jgi:cytidylate kinase
MRKNFIIAIDGPAGAGKTTVARIVARELGFLHIDTGAMYRALTWKAVREGVDLNNRQQLAELARRTQIDFRKNNDRVQILVDGQEVAEELRTPEITNNIYHIADCEEVRKIMVARQRELGNAGGVILEGRDITTIVFPDADFKFYLDASQEERFRRRLGELKSKGVNVNPKKMRNDICARDKKDFQRPVGGLQVAAGAMVVDTTGKSIEEVVKIIRGKILG